MVGFSPPPKDGVRTTCPPDLPEAAELRSLAEKDSRPCRSSQPVCPECIEVVQIWVLGQALARLSGALCPSAGFYGVRWCTFKELQH